MSQMVHHGQTWVNIIVNLVELLIGAIFIDLLKDIFIFLIRSLQLPEIFLLVFEEMLHNGLTLNQVGSNLLIEL